MKLTEYAESMAYEVAFWAQGLSDPNYPMAELGDLSIEVSRKLRALAIMGLVVAADSDSFHHNLIRSGRVRLAYLERLQSAQQMEDHHRCSGRYEPLLDVIAASEFAVAQRITALSPAEFREGHEYEDDYCYAQILSRWIQDPTQEQKVSSFLDRFTAYADGEPNARLTVCRALAVRDQAAFDEAFAGLLGNRELEIEAAKARGELEEPHIVAQRRVFVEGLAILRLAERHGLCTEQEYRYCPSLARAPMRTAFPGE